LSGRDGLLAKFDFVPFEFAQNLDRGIDVPAFVGVDANRAGVVRTDRADRLHLLGRRAEAELDFKNRRVGDFGELAHRQLRIGNADRLRGLRRFRRVETEQSVERLAELFADEIVQREIEARACRRRNAGVKQVFEAVGIVNGEWVRFEITHNALNRFTVPLDRRRLADALVVMMAQANDRRVSDGLGLAARDLKRMQQRQVERQDGEREHRRRFQPAIAPSSACVAWCLTAGGTVEGLDCV
jgi:hypothetical protein